MFGLFSFFVFHGKSGITNNHPNGSSDISFKSPISRDWNDF